MYLIGDRLLREKKYKYISWGILKEVNLNCTTLVSDPEQVGTSIKHIITGLLRTDKTFCSFLSK